VVLKTTILKVHTQSNPNFKFLFLQILKPKRKKKDFFFTKLKLLYQVSKKLDQHESKEQLNIPIQNFEPNLRVGSVITRRIYNNSASVVVPIYKSRLERFKAGKNDSATAVCY
jgi:hypothetical protein